MAQECRIFKAPTEVNVNHLDTYDVVTLSFMYKDLACLTEHKWIWENIEAPKSEFIDLELKESKKTTDKSASFDPREL